MARRSAEMKEEIRANIIQSAMELFLNQGIGGTTMQQVASKVGISHRTLYRYFKDKDALACEIAVIQRGQLEDIRHAALIDTGTGLERVKEHISFLVHFQCMLSTLRSSRFLAEYDHYDHFVTGGIPNEDLNAMTDRYEEIIEEMLLLGQSDGTIRADLDAKTSASMFVHVYIYIVHQMAACYREDDKEGAPDTSHIRAFFTHYIQGIENL